MFSQRKPLIYSEAALPIVRISRQSRIEFQVDRGEPSAMPLPTLPTPVHGTAAVAQSRKRSSPDSLHSAKSR
jgi:hypothetical protein